MGYLNAEVDPQGATVLSQHPRAIQIGQILIEQGVLTEQQVFEIGQAQKDNSLPFGVLAEQMFDVTVQSIEQAWGEQYCRFTGPIDLSTESIDRDVLQLIHRRQAWQFEILPLRFGLFPDRRDGAVACILEGALSHARGHGRTTVPCSGALAVKRLKTTVSAAACHETVFPASGGAVI